MALAFGLSFGIGAKDVTRNILAGFYARRTLQVGKSVEMGGESGVLAAITPTHAVIEVEERRINVANTVFLEQVSRQ